MDSVTHVAGSVVSVGERILQRCMVCGEKMADNYGVCLALNEDGTLPEFPTWEPSTLVRVVSHEGKRSWLPLTHTKDDLPGELPEDSCIALVE